MGDKAKIIERLDQLVSNTNRLVEAIPKSASRFTKAVEIAISIVTFAGLFSVIDIIKNWLGG